MILLITPTRRTTYSHSEFLTKHKNGIIEIMDVSSRKVVDRIIPEMAVFRPDGILEIRGKEYYGIEQKIKKKNFNAGVWKW